MHVQMPQMPNTGSAIGSSTMILAILLKDLQDQNIYFFHHAYKTIILLLLTKISCCIVMCMYPFLLPFVARTIIIAIVTYIRLHMLRLS